MLKKNLYFRFHNVKIELLDLTNLAIIINHIQQYFNIKISDHWVRISGGV